MPKHSGYVSIVGRPNVGKSTLLNKLIGEKIAGVSPKPQTTRNTIRGILSREEGQIVFWDTPGMHEPQDLLGNWMAREVEAAFEEADLVYWLILPERPHPYDRKILEIIKKIEIPVFLIVNQIDKFSKNNIIPVLDRYNQAHRFTELIPISAQTGEQVDLLIEKTFEHLPEGEPLFPEDQISDQNERFISAEMVREKLFHFTSEEVPYATAVEIESFKERTDKLIDISAVIYVLKESQKGIVIGKDGEKLKQIGKAARLDLERFLGRKVFLQLWVKVREWKDNKEMMRDLGYF